MAIGILISLLWAAAYALQLIWLAMLYWSRIVDFVRSRSYLVQDDRNKIAFSLQDRLSGGNYKTVYGIFDKAENNLVDAEYIDPDEIDEELYSMHSRNELLILK